MAKKKKTHPTVQISKRTEQKIHPEILQFWVDRIGMCSWKNLPNFKRTDTIKIVCVVDGGSLEIKVRDKFSWKVYGLARLTKDEFLFFWDGDIYSSEEEMLRRVRLGAFE